MTRVLGYTCTGRVLGSSWPDLESRQAKRTIREGMT